MCASLSGLGDQEREWTSEADSQDGKRGALWGAGSHTVTMETQLVPEACITFVALHMLCGCFHLCHFGGKTY